MFLEGASGDEVAVRAKPLVIGAYAAPPATLGTPDPRRTIRADDGARWQPTAHAAGTLGPPADISGT